MTSLPAARTPDPAAAPPLRWGILAPGWIATNFAESALLHTHQQLAAVGSRSAERARAFAARYGIPRVHDSYEALVSDPEVDAIYVASPHSEHHAHGLLALQAGKHVLIEKAFARNAGEARDLIAAARASKVTLMEAMWTRFLPRTDIVRQLLETGALGELESVRADHGQLLTHIPRLVQPELAGGALLDLGIYPLSWSFFVLGRPGTVQASGTTLDSGVDRQTSITLSGYADHPLAHAQLQTTLAAKTPTTSDINGSAGRIELDGDFYAPGAVRFFDNDGGSQTSAAALIPGHRGMAHEIAHFAQLVADNAAESPLLPLSETLAILEVLDEIRAQVGVRFPGE